MSTKNIQLVVLDMAGTTILDEHEVEHCFKKAAQKNGLLSSDERILALQGYAKLYVFQTLWTEQLEEGDPTIAQKAQNSYQDFTQILEEHYLNNEVKPTEGCLELFTYLHQQGIYIALSTGFYRKVANIILDKIGWGKNLNQNYMNIQNKTGIHLSICPDEVQGAGRPSPKMIELAMLRFGITDKNQVINVGDTPVDLAFGKNAGVRLALGVCNGTHTREQLEAHPNDGLLNNIAELIPIIEKINHEKI
ncbi:HAD family hydrolase [Aquirufa aurantiipilula]|uniref:HAD hydrolase-like protein n=1 Tax=Aquirufa aurantiipilula TaxID=2696561 RepID=A0ABT6BHZ4_9BACT|nr:HAD family hydrolase [Aquirufa aurantiipilula]MDF5690080.1 HAD hydrolase-like protein [Aquirufa aurantiipilula]